MSGPAHTPLPWTVYSGKLRPQFPTRIIEIQGEAGETIVAWPGFDGLDMSHRKRMKNAEFIVRAVNHHAALVEALQRVIAAEEAFVADTGLPWTDDVTRAIEQARAVLASAQPTEDA